MKILQGGVPKCGNFWLYQLLQQVLRSTGCEAGSFIEKQPIYELARSWDLNYPGQAAIDVLEITDLQCAYRISSIYRQPIASLPQYLAQTAHVWTHSPICKRSAEVFAQFDRLVYIIRDPRDRALSAAQYYTSPYMRTYFPQEETDAERFLARHFDALLHEWTWHVFDHLRLSRAHDIHLVFFENLLADFQGELDRLSAYLGLSLSPEARRAIELAVSFERLKKHNPKHLKRGTAGHWRQQLAAQQQARAIALAGPLIALLGYGGEGPPGLPAGMGTEEFGALRRELVARWED